MEHAPLVNEDDEANECVSSDEFELKTRYSKNFFTPDCKYSPLGQHPRRKWVYPVHRSSRSAGTKRTRLNRAM